MSTIVLQDPQSGALVYLRVAELRQKCRVCGLPLEGHWAAATDSSGWACLEHLTATLLAIPMCAEFEGRAKVRLVMEGKHPGDTVVVTRSMLAALGLKR